MEMPPNYVFKPTAEQSLRSNQSAARRRLNTALDPETELRRFWLAGAESYW